MTADIEPFRGIFLGLFFVTTGSNFDVPLFLEQVAATLPPLPLGHENDVYTHTHALAPIAPAPWCTTLAAAAAKVACPQ